MHVDYFCVFGPSLPVRYAWLEEDADRQFLARLYEQRREMFVVRKEVENNQFDYSSLVKIADAELMDFTVRRQLARDFVWMCKATTVPADTQVVTLNLIVAVQTLLMSPQGRGDVFLGALHQALQGRCVVKEVVCWDNSPHDVHPEVFASAKGGRK
jgi:hypothetical protein